MAQAGMRVGGGMYFARSTYEGSSLHDFLATSNDFSPTAYGNDCFIAWWTRLAVDSQLYLSLVALKHGELEGGQAFGQCHPQMFNKVSEFYGAGQSLCLGVYPNSLHFAMSKQDSHLRVADRTIRKSFSDFKSPLDNFQFVDQLITSFDLEIEKYRNREIYNLR